MSDEELLHSLRLLIAAGWEDDGAGTCAFLHVSQVPWARRWRDRILCFLRRRPMFHYYVLTETELVGCYDFEEE